MNERPGSWKGRPVDRKQALEMIRELRTRCAQLELELLGEIAVPDRPALPLLQRPDPGDLLVTLDQAAASVARAKRTLEDYRRRGVMPEPAVKGRRGQPHLWRWSELRPWLEKTFSMELDADRPIARRGRRL